MPSPHVLFLLALTLAVLRVSAISTSPSVKKRSATPPRPLRRCSANRCARRGARTKCLFKRGGKRFSCAHFARTAASRKQCAFACILICNPPKKQPLASNGRRFCSACQLKAFSCGSGYRVYGPVREPRDACAVSYCGMNGAAAKCKFAGRASTCGKWAFTEEKRKACDFACLQICLLDGPTDNTGKGYCSLCHLLDASCASDFKIFVTDKGGSPGGPVAVRL